MNSELKFKIDNAPQAPGCYFWKDKYNNIIYVGKAKNIRKRIKQYFSGTNNLRTQKLVNAINDVDYIIVNNENEALVLENNLIKTHKPKFNVLLKENSNYPYILITNEKHPRLVYTRKYSNKCAKAYGPFPSNDVNTYEFYNLLQRIFPFRKCNVIPKHKCIFYDLKQCLGPCINNVDLKLYDEYKKQINDLFNNKTSHLLNELKQKEIFYANNLDFENAKQYLDLQKSLKGINQKQVVEFYQSTTTDIIGFFNDEQYLSIIIFNIHDGKLIAKNEYISYYVNNDIEEVVVSYLYQYYSENKTPHSIYINLSTKNIELMNKTLNVKVVRAINSKYKTLILTAIKNAQKYLIDHRLKYESYYNRTIGACEQLQLILSLMNLTRIDMIDNSSIFNDAPVSVFVSYINGIKEKKLYRKINLDNVNNKSDYHYMIYAINKRYQKITTKDDLPDLLIVDGGKTQLNAALKALNDLNLTISCIGLKKNDKHKTEAIITRDKEIPLDKTSNLYYFLSNIQNEVHRFAISSFRIKKRKSEFSKIIDNIKGLGPKTKAKLLAIYPNIYDLKKVSIETLKQIVGEKIAHEIIKRIEEIENEDSNC